MVFKEKNFPPQCPPSDAIQQDVEPVFRLTKSETLQEADFLNHRESKKRYPSDLECEALAISFFTKREAAERLRRKHKHFRNKVINKGKITEECGIHNIRGSHLNLWLFQDVDMLKMFAGDIEEG
ncbi:MULTISPECIES: hypothetical protein [Bacillus]|uniref:hypothetical protein n=1 Tax=Bacillus TaxID=1386 RepID=UPI0002532711|nr:hypothetical protein [Bacillus velezensis]UYV21170.1 hypothetical protein K9864_11625 [Bacillus velezensis]WDV98504.1 hypothetical protein PWA59_11720 [Bacillus velezensis]WMX42876.1 hypothetical protein RGQ10_07475 [Bacillus velezensis]CCG50184.1 hypothetical protein BANAU_2163 [Bacillus velezensis YAU B9601-Y2]